MRLLGIALLLNLCACGRAPTPEVAPAPPPGPGPSSRDGAGVTYLGLERTNGFGNFYSHKIAVDLSTRKARISADFYDEVGVPLLGIEAPGPVSCHFELDLSPESTRRLSTLAQGLRFCPAGASGTHTGETDDLELAGARGSSRRVSKLPRGRQETYACSGAPALYGHLRARITPHIPSHCPRSFQRLFLFY